MSVELVGVAQVLLPHKNVVLLGVPVADKSIIPIVTAPVAEEFAVPADIKVPLVLVNELTPPLPVGVFIQPKLPEDVN